MPDWDHPNVGSRVLLFATPLGGRLAGTLCSPCATAGILCRPPALLWRCLPRLQLGKAPKARDFTNCRTRMAGGEVDEVKRRKNRNKSKIRARVEHIFAVIKRLWGFAKVRYRGLAKNAGRAFTALALANIYLSQNRLMAQVRP